jgi:hypothetical protein
MKAVYLVASAERHETGLLPKHFLPLNKGEWREAPRGFNSIIPSLSPKCRLKDKLNLPRRWRGDPSLLRGDLGNSPKQAWAEKYEG